MMTLSINDRVSYQGEKATVKQVWKKKVKVILSDLREMTVGIDEIRPADEVVPAQLPLIDLSIYQLTDRPISQWDLENEDAIENWTPDSETLTPDSDRSENAIDAIKIDVQSLTTDQLINLYEVIARELHYRDESECSLPNPLPNPHPNSLPNPLPNPHPNSLPNSLPNSHPNSLPNSHPNSLPNPHPNYGYGEIKTIKGRMYRYWRWLENGKLRSKYLGRVASSVK